MDQRKVLVLAGILGVLIIAIIIGTIIYVTHNSSISSTVPTIVTSSPLPLPSSSIPVSSPAPRASSAPSNIKTYNGTGFQVQYPNTWGLLTCSNSNSFELDPANSIDQIKVSCNAAVKSVTILVHQVSCSGQTVKLGNVSVIKSVDPSGGRTDYRWCTQTNPMLDISHRFSPSGGTATSTTDYSSQVEDMISKIYFGAGS